MTHTTFVAWEVQIARTEPVIVIASLRHMAKAIVLRSAHDAGHTDVGWTDVRAKRAPHYDALVGNEPNWTAMRVDYAQTRLRRLEGLERTD